MVRSRAVSVLSGSLPWLIVLAGLGLRLGQYRHDRSLFLDEVSVATNIAHKGYMELVRNAAVRPVCPGRLPVCREGDLRPVGAERLRAAARVACRRMFGHGDVLLVARRFAGRAPAMLATAFFALSSSQVYYASELKPYALDVLASMAMIAAFAELDGRRIGALAPQDWDYWAPWPFSSPSRSPSSWQGWGPVPEFGNWRPVAGPKWAGSPLSPRCGSPALWASISSNSATSTAMPDG